MDYKLLNDKNLVISSSIIKYIDKSMTLNEFLVLMYFINNMDDLFDAKKISDLLNISLEDVLEAFNNLINREYIDLIQGKDDENRLIDKISLEKLYQKVITNLNEEVSLENKEDIYDLIAKKFDRKLTPIDLEIINAWHDIQTPEDLIKGALDEAIYNGNKTIKYMDQKIYEWNKLGFKSMKDVENHLSTKDNNNQEELFDYDWLDDDE
ncbi:MAG: DnaD domain protein [Bacilli bacterium]|nr:DnaD domain protein [Bacilli bacterium]